MGTVALLCFQTLIDLKVSLDWHLWYEGDDIPWLRVHAHAGKHFDRSQTGAPDSSNSDSSEDDDDSRHSRTNEDSIWPERVVNISERATDETVELYLAELQVRDYLKRKGDALFKEQPMNLDDIRFGDSLTPADVTRFKSRIQERKAAFGNGVDLPPPIRVPPHEIHLKPGVKPVHMPLPRYTPAKEEDLTKWARSVLASGLFEWAGDSEWAFQVHLAFKEGPPGLEREQFEIRPCGNYPLLNDRTEKMAPNGKSLKHGYENFPPSAIMFIEADGEKFYNQTELHPNSRDYCTLITPIGKIRPTRVVEGLNNAGTVAQAAMDRALATMPTEERKLFMNYMDDLNGGVSSVEQMEVALVALLDMCIRFGIRLKPSKMKIGFDKANMGGFEIGGGKRRLAEKHLEPLAQLRAPSNVSELRRVLGLFVQLNGYVKDYAVIARPLTRLTGNMTWRWTEVEQNSFDKLKNLTCARPSLWNPDHTRALYLDTDASEDGWGYTMYHQGPNGQKEVICFGSHAFFFFFFWLTRMERCHGQTPCVI